MPHSHFVCATCIDFQFVSLRLCIITYLVNLEFGGFFQECGGGCCCWGGGGRLVCVSGTNGVLIKNHLRVNSFFIKPCPNVMDGGGRVPGECTCAPLVKRDLLLVNRSFSHTVTSIQSLELPALGATLSRSEPEFGRVCPSLPRLFH